MSKFKVSLLFLTVFFAVLLSFSFTSNAQVAITIDLNHKSYMKYEAIYAEVSLRNYSGHALAFGENPNLHGKLYFEIFTQGGELVQMASKEYPSLKGIVIAPGVSRKVTIPVSKYYKSFPVGKYRIIAYVEHAQFTNAYQSNTVTFTVSSGITVWKSSAGVPDTLEKKDTRNIKARNYKIISLYDGSHKIFYLVIDDDTNVHAVKRIGYEMGSAIPACEIDYLSRLHIMLQLSPKIFVYMLYDINGKLDDKAVYKKIGEEPILVRNPDTGEVLVAGGEKARKDFDYKEDAEIPFKE